MVFAYHSESGGSADNFRIVRSLEWIGRNFPYFFRLSPTASAQAPHIGGVCPSIAYALTAAFNF